MRTLKKALFIIVAILLVVATHVASFFSAGAFFCDFALLRYQKLMSEILENAKSTSDQQQSYIVEDEWLEAVPNKTTIEQTSEDGLRLKAIRIERETPSDKWAIVVHGYRGNAKGMSNYAKHFYDEGFNVLMPHLRAHGESEGDYISMGWLDRIDVLGWIDIIVDENPNAKIALLGVSMGAATVMMTTGEELPENVKVAVSDCGYSSVVDEFAHILNYYMLSRTFPILDASNYFAKAKFGFDLYDASAVKQLNKSVTPTIFIHGSADEFVPFFMLDMVYDAATNLVEGTTKQKVVIEGAEHTMSASVDPDTYWNSVLNFVSMHIA